MWDHTYVTIGGYLGDGEIICPECFAKRDKERPGVLVSCSIAELESNFNDDGLTCGTCGDEIVAPAETEHAYGEDGTPS